jgi:response regulator RpfG family c-di-GMP phosphodiesterase
MSNELNQTDTLQKPTILHISTREVLRPIRDQMLRLAGYEVISCDGYDQALNVARKNTVELILIDIESERQVKEAEHLCSALKSHDLAQRVAFVCNWRIAVIVECPDHVVRSEFDPVGFLSGVGNLLPVYSN